MCVCIYVMLTWHIYIYVTVIISHSYTKFQLDIERFLRTIVSMLIQINQKFSQKQILNILDHTQIKSIDTSILNFV